MPLPLRRIEDRARLAPLERPVESDGWRARERVTSLEMLSDCARVPALERALLLGHIFAREDRPDGVWNALATHAAPVVRGWTAACLVPDRKGNLRRYSADPNADAGTREVGRPDLLETKQLGHRAEDGVPFAAALIARETRSRQWPAFGSLAWLFQHPDVHCAACINIGRRGVLIIVERRTGRAFEPDDWYRLRVIAEQAEVTLRRIELVSRRSRRRQAP
jgi:hypothetical protein